MILIAASTGITSQLVPVFLVSALVLSLAQYLRQQSKQKYLKAFAWVGLDKNEWFSIIRGSVRSLKHAAQYGLEGYAKFSKQGKLWVCVDHAGNPEIMISFSHLEEALKVDAVVLDTHKHISLLMAEKYTFGGYGVPLTVAAHQDTLLKGVNRALHTMTPAMCQETDLAITKNWGESIEWREMGIMAACADVVGQITNRMLVGLPLCRDDEFLQKSKTWSKVVLQTAWAVYMLPDLLKPIIAPILAIPNLYFHHRALRLLIPVAQQRLEDRRRKTQNPDDAWEEPLDYMKFLLDEGADAFNHVMDENAVTLARAALMVNAAAFHATGLTLANLLLDVFSAPVEVVEGLREEVLRIKSEYGLESKLGLSKMIRTDSAIRESMRLHVLGIKAMHRYIKPAKGYTFSNGDHLPQGSHISLPVLGRHMDEIIYPNAKVYDAFRFSRDREGGGVGASEKRVKAAVNASAEHLSWGIGKSQCPGRFFAVDELKEIMAYILLHYDIKHIKERPKNIFVSSHSLPPLTAKICIRKRKEEKETVGNTGLHAIR